MAPANTADGLVRQLKKARGKFIRVLWRTWRGNAAVDARLYRQQGRPHCGENGKQNLVFTLCTGYECRVRLIMRHLVCDTDWPVTACQAGRCDAVCGPGRPEPPVPSDAVRLWPGGAPVTRRICALGAVSFGGRVNCEYPLGTEHDRALTPVITEARGEGESDRRGEREGQEGGEGGKK